MKADVVDVNGLPVRGDVGELILRASWPGMTQSLWAGSATARDDERYLATYWQRLPNCWTHGDWAEVEEVAIPADRCYATGATQTFWYIRGRSDDTINVAGKRVGPAEFESVLCSHAKVREAAAIAVPDAVKGDVVVCLVVASIETGELEALRKELFAQVDHELGHALRPKAIKFVDELPKTRNGKVMRRLARARYLDLPELGDLSGLENPSALEAVARAL
jgi:acetyl-CoA synthetase